MPPGRPSKCHEHHKQQFCKIFWAGVNLGLYTSGVSSRFFLIFFVAFCCSFCPKVPRNKWQKKFGIFVNVNFGYFLLNCVCYLLL